MAADENDNVMNDYSNYSLKDYNTFGIEARCRRFIEFEDFEEAVLAALFECDSHMG
jgi:UDP-N-acetylenolpyruvoylglucosamine reductase